MEYCKRCVYPANARPSIIFDDEGVCSGCRYHESRASIDWADREEKLREILQHYKGLARAKGAPYDCIIPVGGGKDSTFQTYYLTQVCGMRALLVAYNHCFNTPVGNKNLRNLLAVSGCDLIRVNANLESARKISRHMLKTVGDLTWHYHAGIRTVPFQVAARYEIPLVMLGEHGFAELTGMFTLEDLVEHTKWSRREHDMRGFEPEDLISEQTGISLQDVGPYIYPDDEVVSKVGIRGVYLSNYINWNGKSQTELVIDKFGFSPFTSKRDRTFNLYSKIEDHANDVHDYLKYLKFGYGRCTDDVSTEIRLGRMTREEGIELVGKYDHVRPRSLDFYLQFLGVSEEEMMAVVDPMRDSEIWQRTSDGSWKVTDSVTNHLHDSGIDAHRPTLCPPEERTFSERNRHLYFSEKLWKDYSLENIEFEVM